MSTNTADLFKVDTAQHKMTIIREEGVYRHVRFQRPDSGICHWDLVTWPGHLAITGDLHGHVFARVNDMFEFFRAKSGWNPGTINPQYWAEKIVTGRENVKSYAEDKFRAELKSQLAEYEKDYPDRAHSYDLAMAAFDLLPLSDRWPHDGLRAAREPVAPTSPDDLRDLIADHDDNGNLSHEDGARELLAELERADVVSDTWEWDLCDWSHHYLWCCHAIQWGISQYDALSTPAAAVAA